MAEIKVRKAKSLLSRMSECPLDCLRMLDNLRRSELLTRHWHTDTLRVVLSKFAMNLPVQRRFSSLPDTGAVPWPWRNPDLLSQFTALHQ